MHVNSPHAMSGFFQIMYTVICAGVSKFFFLVSIEKLPKTYIAPKTQVLGQATSYSHQYLYSDCHPNTDLLPIEEHS